MREGDDPRLTLEVALLKVATPSLDSSREALLRRIESLEARLSGGAVGGTDPEGSLGGRSSSAGARESDSSPARPSGDVASDRPTEPDVQETKAAPEASTATATASVDIERVVELWPAVVDQVRDSGSAMLSSLFDEAKPVGIDEERGVLRIGFPASAKFNKKKAESSANLERMADAIGAIVGTRLRPAYELIDGPGEEGEPEEKTEMSEEELVDLVKDSFDASEVLPDEERERGTG